MIYRARHKKIDRLFHAWLDCFTVSLLGAAVCLLAILWTNRRIDFHEISRIYRLWHKEPPGKIVVVMRWTPWKQGLFSGSVFFSPFFATLGINGWIFRIWIKEKMIDWFTPGYIVSRSQTRRGACLHSRSVSCWPRCCHLGCLVNRDKG